MSLVEIKEELVLKLKDYSPKNKSLTLHTFLGFKKPDLEILLNRLEDLSPNMKELPAKPMSFSADLKSYYKQLNDFYDLSFTKQDSLTGREIELVFPTVVYESLRKYFIAHS